MGPVLGDATLVLACGQHGGLQDYVFSSGMVKGGQGESDRPRPASEGKTCHL